MNDVHLAISSISIGWPWPFSLKKNTLRGQDLCLGTYTYTHSLLYIHAMAIFFKKCHSDAWKLQNSCLGICTYALCLIHTHTYKKQRYA